MASPSTMCASCLRAARRATTRGGIKPAPVFWRPARAYSKAAATSQPLYLDFLAPSIRSVSRRPTSTIKTPFATISNSQSIPRRALATPSATSTPSDPQPAHPILNPRTTPSGEPLRISLSPRAASRLAAIASTDQNPNLALRITIESGGCHGFQYLMSLTDLSTSPATEEDTVFEGDKGAKVVIDESSLELLNGSTVDYTMELIGSQFKVTGIPGATSSCGCGTSFDIKL